MSPIAPVSPAPERAKAYRDHVAEPLERPFAEALAGRALLAAGHSVLELACGVGRLARRLSRIVGERGAVTAVDDDRRALDLAREVAGETSGEAIPEVAWRRAEPGALPFDDASFDAALSAHGFARLAEPEVALGELRRVLRTGGRVSLAVWAAAERNPFFAIVSETLGRHLDPAAEKELAAYQRALALGEPERSKALLEAAGFVLVSAEELRLDIELPALDAYLPGYLHAVGFGEAIGRLDAAPRDALLRELRGAVEARLDGGSALPFRSVLAFGRCGAPEVGAG